jgi:hypothetical protein
VRALVYRGHNLHSGTTSVSGNAPIDAELGAAIAGRANRIVAPPSRGNPVGTPASSAQPAASGAGGAAGAADEPLWPATLLRDSLAYYARFADRALSVNVYKCECYFRADAAPLVVPFFSRVELGQVSCCFR